MVQFVDDRRLAAGLPLLPSPSRGGREGQGAGLQEPRPSCARTSRPILLPPHARVGAAAAAAADDARSSASRRPTSSWSCTTATCGSSSIDRRARRIITEMDLLRLQKALLMCRMSADSTFLVDKEPPGYSSKLEYLGELLDGLFAEPDRKALLFSEWTTMLDLIEPMLERAQAATTCGWTARCRRRSGSNWSTASSDDPRLPAVHHHQRRLDGPEPPGGQHGHQRRSAVEPGRARAADRAGPTAWARSSRCRSTCW